MEKQRLKIGLDVDGVLADFVGAGRKFFKAKYGKPDDSLVQTEWDFDCLGISKAETDELWNHIHTTWNWWTTLDTIDGAYSLGWLCNNHTVYFITNRPTKCTGLSIEEQTQDWLMDSHYLECPTVIVCKNKGALASALDLDLFLDDNVPNVMDVSLTSPRTTTFIKDAPYNQECVLVPRLKNVNELVHLVQAMEGPEDV